MATWFERGYVGRDGQEHITDKCVAADIREAVAIFNDRNVEGQPPILFAFGCIVESPEIVRACEPPVTAFGEPMASAEFGKTD